MRRSGFRKPLGSIGSINMNKLINQRISQPYLPPVKQTLTMKAEHKRNVNRNKKLQIRRRIFGGRKTFKKKKYYKRRRGRSAKIHNSS